MQRTPFEFGAQGHLFVKNTCLCPQARSGFDELYITGKSGVVLTEFNDQTRGRVQTAATVIKAIVIPNRVGRDGAFLGNQNRRTVGGINIRNRHIVISIVDRKARIVAQREGQRRAE